MLFRSGAHLSSGPDTLGLRGTDDVLSGEIRVEQHDRQPIISFPSIGRFLIPIRGFLDVEISAIESGVIPVVALGKKYERPLNSADLRAILHLT